MHAGMPHRRDMFFKEFTDETSMHGFKYLQQRNWCHRYVLTLANGDSFVQNRLAVVDYWRHDDDGDTDLPEVQGMGRDAVQHEDRD